MLNDGPRSVGDRLLALAEKRATGVLALQRGQVHKQLFIHEGCLVAAESNLREEALGEVLIALGILGPSRLPQVLAEMRARGQKMGAILVDMGWTSPETVLAALSAQVRLRARNCLRWRETEASFDATDAFVGQQLAYPNPLPPLVFTGLRDSTSVERFVDALDGDRPIVVGLSHRWAVHRGGFAEVFGTALEEQTTACTCLQELAARPDAPALLTALDALLESGLGYLQDEGEIPAPRDVSRGFAVVTTTQRHETNGVVETPEASHLDRLDAEIAFTEGKAAVAAGRISDAVASLRRAIRLRRDQAAYHAWLGWTLCQDESGSDQQTEGLAQLREAVAIDPDSVEGNHWLGCGLYAAGQREDARRHLEKAFQAAPTRAGVGELLGRLYVEAGAVGEAEKVYQRVLAAIGSGDPALQERIGAVLARLRPSPRTSIT